MSPKPTVANTVTVKYMASIRVRGWVKFAGSWPTLRVGGGERHDEEQQDEDHGLRRPQPGVRGARDRAELPPQRHAEQDEPPEEHGGRGPVLETVPRGPA